MPQDKKHHRTSFSLTAKLPSPLQLGSIGYASKLYIHFLVYDCVHISTCALMYLCSYAEYNLIIHNFDEILAAILVLSIWNGSYFILMGLPDFNEYDQHSETIQSFSITKLISRALCCGLDCDGLIHCRCQPKYKRIRRRARSYSLSLAGCSWWRLQNSFCRALERDPTQKHGSRHCTSFIPSICTSYSHSQQEEKKSKEALFEAIVRLILMSIKARFALVWGWKLVLPVETFLVFCFLYIQKQSKTKQKPSCEDLYSSQDKHCIFLMFD